MDETGTLRIRYEGKKTVFEYARLRRKDVAEKLAEHAALYPVDAAPDPNAPEHRLDGAGFEVRPLAKMSAEWVTNPGPRETVTPLEVPEPKS